VGRLDRRGAPAGRGGPGGRAARWATAPLRPAGLGIRPVDLAAALAVIIAVELTSAVATGPGQRPLNALAWAFGAVVAVPVAARHRWPREVLIACSALLMVFYLADRRDISPAPLLCLPLYDAAAAGALALAVVVPVFYMSAGFVVVGAATHQGLASLASEFLPSAVVLLLAVLLGDTVRSRRELAAETARRLRLAAEERDAEGARRVAEERLRIARDLHDTVAHSMATITVQAAAATQLLPGRPDEAADSLRAIRAASKEGLRELRAILNVLRAASDSDESGQPNQPAPGLSRLDALLGGVRAAGLPVTATATGRRPDLAAVTDLSAFRIIQEALTNTLRHAGPASAVVTVHYAADALLIEVTDTGRGLIGPAAEAAYASFLVGAGAPVTADADYDRLAGGQGHGLRGMRERAAAAGGAVEAGPRAEGGFRVAATLPFSPPPVPQAPPADPGPDAALPAVRPPAAPSPAARPPANEEAKR
jgi:signal transduction histidine kinase